MTRPTTPPPPRIALLDLARGIALVAMATYHFTWDLEFFGYIEPGTTAVGGWKLYARGIATTFLVLVGIGLWLAHGRGVRWDGFWRRFAMITAAAVAITIATWYATPDAFIFFGILHQIALASVLGLAFLRLPGPFLLVLAGALVTASYLLRTPFFDGPIWWWTGLSQSLPRSNDYVPLVPWFGAVLAGIGIARIADERGLLHKLSAVRPGNWSRLLRFAGRHSLAVYLIHQPVLIALVWIASQIAPPPVVSREDQFTAACIAQCSGVRDEAFCARYCGCMLDSVKAADRMDAVFTSAPSAETSAMLGDMATLCTAQSVAGEDGGEEPQPQ